MTLVSDNAKAQSDALVELLRKEGLDAKSVQIGLRPERWTITVTTRSEGDQTKARQILLGSVLAQGTLRVDVIQASSHGASSAAPGAASR